MKTWTKSEIIAFFLNTEVYLMLSLLYNSSYHIYLIIVRISHKFIETTQTNKKKISGKLYMTAVTFHSPGVRCTQSTYNHI